MSDNQKDPEEATVRAARFTGKTPMDYDHAAIHAKWQELWARFGVHKVLDDDARPTCYELHMFPYPSGDVHIGHWFAMTGADCHARYMLMNGYNVLHPMGFDAFGLNAENAAIKNGVHPHTWTMTNIEKMRGQLRSMGTMYDWDREIVTCAPEYYMWNQLFFLELYKHGLAYRADAPVNWCSSCQTVLANEQVIDGLCERCDTGVIQRNMEQWFLKITDYADELLDFSKIDWPEKINKSQTNWIGRSEGVEVDFDISEYNLEEKAIPTFTTRIDTVFGVTFVVLAPEHPLVAKLTTSERRDEVEAYVKQACLKTEIDRLSTEKEKTGVFTGAFAVNNLNSERVPILVADYVLLSYGTGMVMGVPAHDQRDYEIAKKYGLPIRVVISPPEWDSSEPDKAYVEAGTQVNSGQFSGLPNSEGLERIAGYIEEQGWGKRTVNYRMRDWLISRQRYWGTPIPVVYCERCGVTPVRKSDLPVLLPEDAEFLPTGDSPLALHEGFVNTDCPGCEGPARRETDTMDTFVDSSWYSLRYTSPKFEDGPFDPIALRNWGAVDLYTGGTEHAVMHLLYARFFIKALRDLGYVDFDEPFVKLVNQGTIVFKDQKMSKSRGNVIAPDEYVSDFGADVVRTFLMFMWPWEGGGSWNEDGISGVARWANRVWNLATHDASVLDELDTHPDAIRRLKRAQHQTIQKVTDDVERFKFNTAIAAMMEFSNLLDQAWESGAVNYDVWIEAIRSLALLMSPIAPFLAEEIWHHIGEPFSIHQQQWPKWDPDLATAETITLIVQVDGRVRDRIEVSAELSEEDARKEALASTRVKAHIEDKTVRDIIYAGGRLINLVTT